MAMLMLSVSSAWAQYVKLTAENGTVSWIKIDGVINGESIEIYKGERKSVINNQTKGSIDLNEVWSESGGIGTHYQVTSIGSWAFYYCSGLTSVVIPSNVTSIEYATFNYCFGLTSVEIPSSVTSIGQDAFRYCIGLTTINIPSSVISIGYGAFRYCKGLTSITIPSSVTSIGDDAFDSCSSLTSVEIPSSVTSIGQDAFSNCSGLTSVVIPSSVKSIEGGVFWNCSGLTSIDIPSSVTSIGASAFRGCIGLTTINIPSSVKSIAPYAFSNCIGLTSVVIPSSVTNIEENPFIGCIGLTSIVVESGNSVFDSRDNCNAIIKTTSNTLIAGCKYTKIPSSVISIRWYAFSNCSSLTSVVIPSSVTRIGQSAFSNCSGLTSITSYITDIFETETNAFSGCDNATLYVPKGLVSTYRSTADWNRINWIEEIPEEIPGAIVLSCNNKGKVIINGRVQFTNDMGEVSIYDGMDNNFVFIPNENCQLEQVLIDGLDVTLSIKNNKLTTMIRENSNMIVSFSKSSGDLNGDGQVDISDVVTIVNMILGQ